MNQIIYLIGLIVVIMLILSFFGLRQRRRELLGHVPVSTVLPELSSAK